MGGVGWKNEKRAIRTSYNGCVCVFVFFSYPSIMINVLLVTWKIARYIILCSCAHKVRPYYRASMVLALNNV